MMRPGAMAMIALIISPTLGSGQEQPRFRAPGDAVVIDVSVLDGRRPVAGLAGADFELVDNGVPQRIITADKSTLPLDISLLVDFSSSIVDGWTGGLIFARHEPAGPWMSDGIKAILSLLRPEDRLRVIEVGSTMRTAKGRALPSGVLSTSAKGQRTALFDAVALALVQKADAGRRRVVIAMSDGHDTSSISDFSLRSRLMARSDAVVHVVAIGIRAFASIGTTRDRAPSPFRRPTSWSANVGSYDWVFRDIAERTGGRFWATNDAGDFVPELRRIVEEFRSRYLLRYIPSGVEREGWHDVEVRLKEDRGWNVQARRGYFIGG